MLLQQTPDELIGQSGASSQRPANLRAIDMCGIALGLFCFMLCSPAFPLAPRLLDRVAPGTSVGIFTVAAGCTIAVAALAVFILFEKPARPLSLSFKQSCGLAVGNMLTFWAGFVLMPYFAQEAFALLFGIVLGLGMLSGFLVWGSALGAIASSIARFGAALLVLCASMAAAALANMALVAAPQALVTAALLAVSFLGVALPCALVRRFGTSEYLLGADKATLGEVLAAIAGANQNEMPSNDDSASPLVSAFHVLLPIAVLLLYASSQLLTHAVQGNHEYLAYSVLAAPALAALPLLLRTDAARPSFALRATLPLFGVVTLGVAVLLPDAYEASAAALGAQALCYAYGITFLALAVYFSATRRPTALPLISVACAACLALVMMLPHLTFSALEGARMPLFLAILVAVLLFAASPSFSAWRGSFAVAQAASSEQHTSTTSDALETEVHAACDALAATYALSQRETEILYYLGRGYGPRYLASILPIKENTIRSHVRNIYAKTDVHTQADLLALIDTFARQ